MHRFSKRFKRQSLCRRSRWLLIKSNVPLASSLQFKTILLSLLFCVIITAAEKIWKKRSAIRVWPALQNRNHNKWHQATTWSKIKHKIVRWMQDKSTKFSFRCARKRNKHQDGKNSRWEANINIIIDILSAVLEFWTQKLKKYMCMNSWYNRDQANDAISSFSLSRCTMKYEMIRFACWKAKGNFIIRSRNLVFCSNICTESSYLKAPPSMIWIHEERTTRDKTIKIKSILFLRNGPKRFLSSAQIVSTMISVKTSEAETSSCWESSVLYFLLLPRVLLFYLTFFSTMLFDTQKWRNSKWNEVRFN